MRKIIVTITGPVLLLSALLACGVATEAAADVRVGVGINLGPHAIKELSALGLQTSLWRIHVRF
jgi:hypothetical protein